MIRTLNELLDMLPPLKRKDPGMASIIGFLAGGVGLGIYFRSFIDMLIPVVLYTALVIAFNQIVSLGWLLGAIVSGVYGHLRVQNSNARLSDLSQ